MSPSGTNESAPLVVRGEGGGRVVLEGALTFDSVKGGLAAGAALIPAGGEVKVDVSGVTRGDSAGLAFLVELKRVAAARGASLSFSGAPEQLMAIVQISNLGELFAEHGDAGQHPAGGQS